MRLVAAVPTASTALVGVAHATQDDYRDIVVDLAARRGRAGVHPASVQPETVAQAAEGVEGFLDKLNALVAGLGSAISAKPRPKQKAVRALDRSRVELEALAAAAAAALTVDDLCKAIDRGMLNGEVRQDEKRGGTSGTWKRR